MNEEKEGTKLCKYCKSEIPAGAKICPNCRKKQGKSGCLIAIIAVVVVFILVGIIAGSGSDDKTASSSQGSTTAQSSSSASSEEPIEYTSYTVDELVSDLDSNAMNASEKYKNQYIEITGRLSNIDSDGKYISLRPENDSFSFVSVTCYIKSDEQKDVIKTKTMDDTITLRGKCKDVGEVLGYSLDIDSID